MEVKLSVVIITFNEAKNIERCLLSVVPVADEIIILDSGSKDATASICAKFPLVKFFIHPFDGHIQQKNRAITYATHAHILSLDADEALDETLQHSILNVKKNWIGDGYEMNRLTNYCGHWVKYCGWYPDKKLRLWNSQKGHWTGINPHDEYKFKETISVKQHIQGNILHYSYYTLADHYKQVEYFTTIAAKAYYEQHKTAPIYKLWVNPLAKFIDHFILHLGFLDGKYGFRISRISAYATYLKYKKLRAFYHA